MADNSSDDLIISISTDMTAVKRALTRLTGDIDAASRDISRKFDKVGTSVDNSITTALQTRINAMVGIGTQAASEWSGALADQGKQLDALRAKYNPLFATIKQYQAAQGNIRTLYASGTIGLDEYSTAMSRQRQAALASIAAIKQRNVAVDEAVAGDEHLQSSSKLSSSQLQALAHSGRSIVEQLALGVPVSQAFTGQLSHLSYVASGPGGVKGALSAIGTGIIGLIESFPLMSAAAAAAGVAAVAYFAATSDGGAKSSEVIEQQVDLIRQVAARWGDAVPALQAYIEQLDHAKDVADTIAAGKAAGDLGFDDARKSVEDLNYQMADAVLTMQDAGNKTETISALTDAWNRVAAAVKDGKTDLQAMADFQAALTDAIGQTHIPVLDKLTTSWDELASKIKEAGKQAQTFNAEAIAALAGGSTVQDITVPATFTDPAGRAHQTSTFLPENVPTPERRPNIELEGMPGDDAREKKAAAAAAELAKRREDLFRTADDHIQTMQSEISLVGQYGGAADKARFALSEWQKAEKLNLDPSQKKALQEKIDQYGKLSDTLAKLKLNSDLAEKTRLAAMSPRDRQIAETQKQYGLEVDPNNDTGKQIGKSLDRDELRSDIESFSSDFSSGLLTKGESIGKAFGESLAKTLCGTSRALPAFLERNLK